MPTPLEVKMKLRAKQIEEAESIKREKRGFFLRNKITRVVFAWSPLLSLEDDMEELKEMPAELVPASQQPTSSQGKDKYDHLDEDDLRGLAEAREIPLGNTKKLDTIRAKLREYDAELEEAEEVTE